MTRWHCLMLLGIIVSISSVFGASRAECRDDYYITPAGDSLAIFHSSAGEQNLHATTSQISGQIQTAPDNASALIEVDLRYLTTEEDSLAIYFDDWLFEALTYPRAVFNLTQLAGWPESGLVPGDSLDLTGSGTLTLHGVTHPVQIPLSLTYQKDNGEEPETAMLSISAIFSLRPVEFGIDIPERYTELMTEIDLRLYLVGHPVPYGVPSRVYSWLLKEAFNLAREYGYPEVEETHILLAGLEPIRKVNGRTISVGEIRGTLERLGISPDSLRTVIEERLKADSPGSSDRRTPMSKTATTIYQREAHWEAYRFKEEKVTPEHFLLAFLARSEHWVTQYLAQRELTYDSFHKVLQGIPKPAKEVILLGKPFRSEDTDSVPLRYARNVWDMQLWNGKIYLGHGNSSNKGPARNAGPIPIISYDLKTGHFETEFTVDEEQIDRYRIIDGQLYVPGHDPRDSWELGNFYRLTDDGWEKVRTIPIGIHAYDILGYQEALFVAEGTVKRAMVSRSSDSGGTWESFILPNARRAYELFTLGDKLYVSAYEGIIYRYTGSGFNRVRVDLFPDARHGRNSLMVRSTHFKDTLLYLGADNVNDHQWTPFAAYKASQIDETQRLKLPSTELPYDILVRNGIAYILTNRFGATDSNATVIIYCSNDLEHWTEIARFDAPTFARSFEYHEGVFYVGLGTAIDPLNEASGTLYRVTPPSP